MALTDILQSIENTGFATSIRESAKLFPLLESFHVIALAFVLGSIAFVDLRLLGLASRDQPVTRLVNNLLPWTWGAFAVAAATGLALLSSTPARYLDNTFLRLKFLCMFLAGVNMIIFHLVTYKGVSRWDTDSLPPHAARIAGGLSILLWVCVVFFGRWIGFTL